MVAGDTVMRVIGYSQPTPDQIAKAKAECFAICKDGGFIDYENGCFTACKSADECQGWHPYVNRNPPPKETP